MTQPLYLGIEGGGTKTTAIFATGDLQVVAHKEFGPGNFRLLSTTGLVELFRSIASTGFSPAAVCIGLAGVRTEADRKQLRTAAEQVWKAIPITATHDLQIALAAATVSDKAHGRMLVLSGTGSCCYGENTAGESAKVGGWGHLLGDLGSGYDISLHALKAVIYEHDRHAKWGLLSEKLLRALVLTSQDELIAWAQSSDKAAIARLAPVVFEAASSGDRVANQVLSQAAEQLASDGVICASRLAEKHEPVAFVLAGSVLRKQMGFARRVAHLIQAKWRGAEVRIAEGDGVLGAVKLAINSGSRGAEALMFSKMRVINQSLVTATPAKEYVPAFDPAKAPTEQRNPKSLNLHKLSVSAAVDLMLEAESEIVPALRKEQRAIERAVRFASESLKSSGRLFYAGAGTSGRLGVLDASECPPTFRSSPDLVQGIMAGGQTALWQAVEGAEDDWTAGAAAVRFRRVTSKDTLVGIAASGRTPFVWGALAEAKQTGSRTVLICFNPALEIDRSHRPDVVIAPNLGPEILTGSTRLKCGTATKIILNTISTLAMVRLGKVLSNLMVDLNPSNIKLRDRAVRIVCDLTNCGREQAQATLEKNGWNVKKAVHALSN
jgi:N-acetylmuramic acid 6-phosphate etherase